MTSKLDAALALAAQGFSVFPLGINSKLPALDSNWRALATTDPDRIRSMWTCPVFDVAMDYNVGVALDKSTLVVDVDIRDGKKGRASLDFLETVNDPLPPTLTVFTPTGGEHRYFKTGRDSGSFPRELAEHIDLKGEGGYVVGPGSTIDGKEYTARGDVDGSQIALAPRWIGDLPEPRRVDRGNRMGAEGLAAEVDLDTPAAIERAIAYLKSAPDHGTFKVAAHVKDLGVSEDTAVGLMVEHWPGADARDEAHIAFRVGNAYRYGQNAPGAKSPEAEFDAVEIDARPAGAVPRRGLYAVRWCDAKPTLDRPYLIDDIYDLGSMVVTYGDSNVGKTYIVLDQCTAIAAGAEWNGHQARKGLVVYVASEGGTGFHKRIEAYRRERGLAELPFSLVPCPIDLHSAGDAGDTDRLIRLVRAEEAHFGTSCVLIVVDTLARAIGAGDENTSVDMGLLVRHCDRLRAATGATVNLIHHTGKDKSKGARGSSSLRAATDTEIEVDAGVVTVQKQRDMARAEPLHFQLKTVEIGRRTDGRAVTACVVEWLASAEFEAKITPEAQQLFDVLEQLEADIPDGTGVSWADWWKAATMVLKGARGKPLGRTHMVPLRHQLSHAKMVELTGAKWRISDQTD